jgi:hypothetical protein
MDLGEKNSSMEAWKVNLKRLKPGKTLPASLSKMRVKRGRKRTEE